MVQLKIKNIFNQIEVYNKRIGSPKSVFLTKSWLRYKWEGKCCSYYDLGTVIVFWALIV